MQTTLLESVGQAHILVMLGVFIHGKAFLKPKAHDAREHLRGYLEGIRLMGWITLPAALQLAVAAVHEALEVI